MTKATHYIYSTLSSAMNYQNYGAGGADLPVATDGVVIQGGANIPDKYMRTPEGAVITPVTDEQLDALQANDVFKLHVANGFIVVKDKKYEPEKVAADMTTRDQSAPLVDSDFIDGQEPIVAKPDEEDDKRSQAPKPQGNGRRA